MSSTSTPHTDPGPSPAHGRRAFSCFSELAILVISLGFAMGSALQAAEQLEFDINFKDGYELGDQHNATGEEVVSDFREGVQMDRPFRRLTSMRHSLGGNNGKWKAVVSEGAPFDGRYLRFEIPANTPFVGMMELFRPPGGDAKGTWFFEFDYARLAEGTGGPELLAVELKNGRGEIMARPAMWYHEWLGNWQIADSNRPLAVGKVHKIRIEVDIDKGTYQIRFDGRRVEEGAAEHLRSWGGVSLVFSGKQANHPRIFGLANLRSGRVD